MDQVNASIKALHSAASNKKQRRDVGDALEQISSVAKLLVIPINHYLYILTPHILEHVSIIHQNV